MTTLIDRIREYASREMHQEDDDFNPMDYAGGNFDDAFNLGTQDGWTECARALLMEFDETTSS